MKTKELKPFDKYKGPYGPKDGDFVAFGTSDGGKPGLQIFEGFVSNGSHNAYATLCVIRETDQYAAQVDFSRDNWTNEGIRHATESEKQQLINALHKIGKDWDAENKKVVAWEWEPKNGEPFYWPSFSYEESIYKVAKNTWSEVWAGWIEGHRFRTFQECDEYCDKLNKAIKNIK